MFLGIFWIRSGAYPKQDFGYRKTGRLQVLTTPFATMLGGLECFREDCLFLTLFLGVGGQIFSGLRRGTRLKELNSGFRFEGFSCCAVGMWILLL